MNPMDGSGARPRASPIAPASSDRYIPPRSRNLASSGTGETMKPDYPRRPGVADCTYYLKFGTCGYGMQCWFNHPDLHSTRRPKPSIHPIRAQQQTDCWCI